MYNSLYTKVMKWRNVKSNLCPSGFPSFPSPSQPSVLLGEDPPPYSPLTSPESGSAPVINCRVCQSLISVEGKIHQHVVKCGVCNEATVSPWNCVKAHTNAVTKVPHIWRFGPTDCCQKQLIMPGWANSIFYCYGSLISHHMMCNIICTHNGRKRVI